MCFVVFVLVIILVMFCTRFYGSVVVVVVVVCVVFVFVLLVFLISFVKYVLNFNTCFKYDLLWCSYVLVFALVCFSSL